MRAKRHYSCKRDYRAKFPLFPLLAFLPHAQALMSLASGPSAAVLCSLKAGAPPVHQSANLAHSRVGRCPPQFARLQIKSGGINKSVLFEDSLLLGSCPTGFNQISTNFEESLFSPLLPPTFWAASTAPEGYRWPVNHCQCFLVNKPVVQRLRCPNALAISRFGGGLRKKRTEEGHRQEIHPALPASLGHYKMERLPTLPAYLEPLPTSKLCFVSCG
ncbi:unnamed protein product [Protopolystoma xenopodis]|uniref:Uncharacterized protein n=1 Tax=Protopolystoma xenopodis TaxID=117903 RepID=A0A448XFR7_9PLAT|nr:unnamed protein product [Protopolystoma xenopodis]